MIARLFNAPLDNHEAEAVGVSTVGSSEACMLAVIAAKRRWKNRRIAEGKPVRSSSFPSFPLGNELNGPHEQFDKPNIVMSSAVQVVWEKAARCPSFLLPPSFLFPSSLLVLLSLPFGRSSWRSPSSVDFEVEEKYWYCRPGQYVLDPKEAVDLVRLLFPLPDDVLLKKPCHVSQCDENTILLVGILGTTYTGEYEDILELNNLLEKKNAETGLDVHIHVDAASGGFVAPFVVPDLPWDFRLPLVCSINVSGHKYGLAWVFSPPPPHSFLKLTARRPSATPESDGASTATSLSCRKKSSSPFVCVFFFLPPFLPSFLSLPYLFTGQLPRLSSSLVHSQLLQVGRPGAFFPFLFF
jgi:glutamate decarboxylase